MKIIKVLLFTSAAIFLSCSEKKGYTSDTLEIHPISDQVFVHKTYLQTEDFGKVGCNGLIYVNDGEAIVFDTPPDDATSDELITYVNEELNAKIIAIVPTHFHGDCLGGLNAFHKKNISSIANRLTIELAGEAGEILPQKEFDTEHVVKVGEEEVLIKHFGEGHTRDNVIAYISNEQVIFGGCLVKSVGAGKGNTADANVNEWSQTALQIKSTFPETKVVIPGHGKWGGIELLDYTAELFDTDQ